MGRPGEKTDFAVIVTTHGPDPTGMKSCFRTQAPMAPLAVSLRGAGSPRVPDDPVRRVRFGMSAMRRNAMGATPMASHSS